MYRFVVLHHEQSSDGEHWDLMLESDQVLTTWSLPPHSLPLESFRSRARRLPDHRIAYLDYEGPVDGNRGTVRRIDTGTYDILETNRFAFDGNVFSGTLSIEPTNGDDVWITFEKGSIPVPG